MEHYQIHVQYYTCNLKCSPFGTLICFGCFLTFGAYQLGGSPNLDILFLEDHSSQGSNYGRPGCIAKGMHSRLIVIPSHFEKYIFLIVLLQATNVWLDRWALLEHIAKPYTSE